MTPPDPAVPCSPQQELAERIAREAHAGQKEQSTGEDYIRHIERVVSLVDSDEEKVVAWLHDVLEDCPQWTAGRINKEGIQPALVLSVVWLTRSRFDEYAIYIERIRTSGDARAIAVKIADLRDHLRPNCPESLRPRYVKALAALSPDPRTQFTPTKAIAQAMRESGQDHFVSPASFTVSEDAAGYAPAHQETEQSCGTASDSGSTSASSSSSALRSTTSCIPSSAPVAEPVIPLDPLKALSATWRERARLNALGAKNDGDSQFAHRLSAVNAAQRQCADELDALLAVSSQSTEEKDDTRVD